MGWGYLTHRVSQDSLMIFSVKGKARRRGNTTTRNQRTYWVDRSGRGHKGKYGKPNEEGNIIKFH
ncbi:hypothetical protein NEUTE1DRAFT_115663 [Neurospora tetrasperma FGSC 2508]|uniref:Uncharacterized protein n=1 Tax=Neurospora tetrasperma (strain FGSC 2508 / ATCC MYA-4615 / P0657) TaxID=510951 RepID=F8MBF6_NEUT8|nr:uncharacterized protein NEUTE1DRAFT_115663 [Neurospora tetrasperma FGSC 2508]EGO60268.1 hypothetical protein NEUTE1DRAFT_115663 [Neurospora tetrasperma FGSC 2508]EGZ75768.1 hypothetical protein NEUTE2DRAFT_143819 [Neurospora tetrasperma FGSC 2509]